jgi:spermidine synthase
MMTRCNFSRGLAAAYAATIFLSAFLLFQVQPLIGKFILPWFGGSPAVWTTCMLVFQVLLFGGYAYAHVTTRYLKPRHQAYLHVVLLTLAILTLPVTPDPAWKPTNSETPALKIVLLTTVCIGLPYFILSSTGPLVQGWFSRTHTGQSPYRLYSLSNLGSLLALVSYPFAVEPAFTTATQSLLWSALFATFVLLCAGSAIVMGRDSTSLLKKGTVPFPQMMLPWQNDTAERDCPLFQQVGEEPRPNESELNANRPSWNLIGLWFGLAMIPSVMLLATTNQVCLDVAVIPFLWVAPLALYLVTFIVCFDGDRWYSRKFFVLAAEVSLAFVCLLFVQGSNGPPLIWQVAGYFSALFFLCMVCHGELVALKPAPQYLTTFYLTISAGGAAGGLFVGVLAPLVFVSYYELHLGIFGFSLLYMTVLLREDRRLKLPIPAWLQAAAVALVLVAAVAFVSQFGRHAVGSMAVARNFYGVLKVERKPSASADDDVVELLHGRIVHGTQFSSPLKRQIPTAYYSEASGVGKALTGHRPGEPKHVGVVGLGIGTLAAYGQSGDEYRLYEINPDVIELAQKHFTFLKDCRAKQILVTGDARLALEFEEPQKFDILVLDAFSGDAVPVHLLTKEAMAVYLKHLQPDGLLAFHISNLHFDLRPVVAGLADEYGLTCVIHQSSADRVTAAKDAVWALLARRPEVLARSVGLTSNSHSPRPPVLWTDDRSNLFEVLSREPVLDVSP